MSTSIRTLSLALTIAVAVLAANAGTGPALAADEIEEIVVTAEKREESLQQTPIAITAFTAEALEEIGAVDVNELSTHAPGVFTHANAGGNTGVVIGIRGAQTGDPETMITPRVGLYVDGVYVAKGAGALFDLVDLERVEVLRGPQGSLYGRNTTGGAVNLISKKPTAEDEFKARLYAGDENDYRISAVLNRPLLGSADALLGEGGIGEVNARLSLSRQSRDGYISNSGSGSDEFDMRDRFAGRLALRWEAADDHVVDYTYERHTVREEPTAFHLTYVRPTSAFAATADVISGGSGAGSVLDVSDHTFTTRQDSINNSTVFLSDGTTEALANDMDITAHTLTSTQDLGDLGPLGQATFKAITSLREVENTDIQDLDGLPAHVAEFKLDFEIDTVSEELQLVGSSGNVDYVLGAFYFSEEGTSDNSQTFFTASRYNTGNDWLVESYAAYAHGNYHPPTNDRLTLGAGLRYTYEEIEAARRYDCVLSAGAACDTSDFSSKAETDFDNVSPMVNLEYQVDDDTMVYGRVARGFSSGGFNGRAVIKSVFETPYEEETLTAYELGLKTRSADNRLMLNAAAFFNDFEDMQVTVFVAGTGGAVTKRENAGKTEMAGGELELVAIPADNALVSASYAYNDAEFKEYLVYDDTAGAFVDQADDRAFPMTPENSFNLNLQYTWPAVELLGMDSSGLTAGINYYWQDDVVFATTDYEHTKQDAYGLVNARMELSDIECEDGSLDLVLWGKNLADEKYRDWGVDFGSAIGHAGNTYGDPLTVGLEMIYNYGG